MYAFYNDQFILETNANLHYSDLGLQRGYAIFDFFRTKNYRPLFLDDHLDRFYYCASELGMAVTHSRTELIEIIIKLIEKNAFAEVGIRLQLTGGYSTDGYNLGKSNLIITSKPIAVKPQYQFLNGIKAITYNHQRELPQIKSINYLTAIWLQPRLKQLQIHDVLYHHNNIISEFPRGNVFIVTCENKIISPSRNILFGITRKKVLELAEKSFAVELRDVTLNELFTAKEVFMTSTTKRLQPVVNIDGKQIGTGLPGPITANLFQEFLKLES